MLRHFMNLEISPEPRKQTGLQGKFVLKRRTWKVNLKDLKRASKQVSYAEVLYIKFYMYLTKLMNNIWGWVYICEFRLFWCNIETSAFVPSLKCLLIFCWHLEIVAAKFQFFHIGFYESRILPFTNFQLNLLGNSLI